MMDVLLVDDDRVVREALADYLGHAGLRVETADSVIRALRVLEREKVLVIVTDDRLPGPAGLMLLEAAKRRWPRAARVLLLKSELSEDDRARAVEVGAEIYYTSDTQTRFLAAMLRLVHERRRTHSP